MEENCSSNMKGLIDTNYPTNESRLLLLDAGTSDNPQPVALAAGILSCEVRCGEECERFFPADPAGESFTVLTRRSRVYRLHGWRIPGDPAQELVFGRLCLPQQRRVIFYEYDRAVDPSGPNGGRGEGLLLLDGAGEGMAGERREFFLTLWVDRFEPGNLTPDGEGYQWTPLT